ncbi:MAG: sigma-70 family RNA polymerase sigma factor [Acidimicrobiia bacterium]|nr:sigma-70 family RNA polymerase sigma factor [Acidimicrobiia bacterium]
MNDQQSPSAPDPQVPPSPPPKPVIRTRRESALSDQEAFALLAESMAEGRNGNGSTGHEPHRKPMKTKVTPPEWRTVEPSRRYPERAGDEHPRRDDIPPVVPFRIASPETDGVSGGDRTHGRAERTANGLHRFDWSTPILVDEQWELVDVPQADPIHGHVTEVIDLTQVPPVVISTDPDEVVTVIGQGIAEADPLLETPVIPEIRPDTTNRILPHVEESNDVEPLPPLVFLNTRGDIVPRVGETPNVGNGATFNREGAAWDGGEPSVATTTNASGVENMADPRGDIEAAADVGRSVGVPSDLGEPGLTNAGDTQILHPRSTPEAPITVDPGPFYTETIPAASNATDPRLDELQRIFDQYSGPVIAVIASIAGDRRAIDEALQSTFEAVWTTVDTFDPEQPRGPWMFTLARRQATEQIEFARRLDQESKPGRYPVPSHRQDAAIAVDKSWEAWEVRLAVDQLTQAEHDVLRLIHNEGLIHPEIAAQLHTTVGAVKSHAYSGSHRLVELLDHVIRPDAAVELTVDQASALTWYLAGVADGSDLGTEERSAVKRVQGQLASATAWITPDAHARERVIAYARRTLDDPGPPSGSEHHGLAYLADDGSVAPVEANRPEVTGRHQLAAEPDKSNSPPWLIVGLSAVGLLALVAAFSLRSGSTEAESETVRRYQLQASGLDADATGFVEITTVATGSRYQLEFGGLDASTDEFFYAAWLQSTAGGGVVPLGTFSWRAAGDPLVLSGPVWSDAYDLLVITRSEAMTRASIDDPPVLSVSIE